MTEQPDFAIRVVPKGALEGSTPKKIVRFARKLRSCRTSIAAFVVMTHNLDAGTPQQSIHFAFLVFILYRSCITFIAYMLEAMGDA
ncbi:hypothetical protein WG907_04260 [Sphingobium sp. AN558]|uniref:hypothetical protein n=1 Tax=Sphingobium sp. AN558 TaxID=3133442 RepID=UPI0030BFA24E